MRPTHALLSAVAVGAAGALVAIVARRVDVLVICTPLLVYAAWALLRRPRAQAPVLTSPQRMRVTEGSSVPLVVQTPASGTGTMVVAWEQDAEVATSPRVPVLIGTLGSPVQVSARTPRWGHYALPPARVSVNDELGAWRLAPDALCGPVVSVVPQTAELQGPDGVRQPVGLAGVHRSAERGDGTEVAGLREFRPGDRVRRINWRVTARTGTPFITESVRDEDTDVVVLLDTTAELPGGVDGLGASSLDLGMRATAAMARYYCARGDRVGVHDLGRVLGTIPAGTGPRQARIVVDAIARARAERWTAAGVVNPLRSVRSGTLVFVVSPLVSNDVLDQIARLRQLGADMVVVDTFPAEAGTVASLEARFSDFGAEALVIRRLQRAGITDSLHHLGIPTATWAGPASLAGVLQAMAATRTAPRLRSAR